LLGPTTNQHYEHLTDAKWYEKVSAITLIGFVAIIGLAPYFLTTMTGASIQPVIDRIMAINPF